MKTSWRTGDGDRVFRVRVSGLCSSGSQITHETLLHLLRKLKNELEACRKGKGSLLRLLCRAKVSCCLHQKHSTMLGSYLQPNILKVVDSLISDFQPKIPGDWFLEVLNAPRCSQVKENCAVNKWSWSLWNPGHSEQTGNGHSWLNCKIRITKVPQIKRVLWRCNLETLRYCSEECLRNALEEIGNSVFREKFT